MPISHRRTAILLLLAAGSALAAEAPPASPLLPPSHWAVKAAERIYEVGLAPGWLPAQRAVPLAVVGRTLAEAASLAEHQAPRYASLARTWDERFRREFPRANQAGQGKVVLAGAAVRGGVELGEARSTPPLSPQPGFIPLTAPKDGPVGDVSGEALLGDHFAVGGHLRADTSDVDLPEVEVVGALGQWAISVGRGPVGYGPNEVGAVVTGGQASVDRVEIMTTAPGRLPGLFDFMGDFAFDSALARFSEARHPYDPLLWEFQLQWRPHPRLTLAAIRGYMFGGTLWHGVPFSEGLENILAINNKIGNNVASGTIQFMLPTEGLLPLTAKVDWGTDDNPGAAWEWPGLVAGLTAPMLPGLPASLGFEYAYFGRGLPGHDPFGWYTHGQYYGGWATGETPLGDPMGGNGRSFRLTATADPWNGLLHFTGRVWIQDRFSANLYAPAASGPSVGGSGEAELRVDRWALGGSGAYEAGAQGWRRAELLMKASLFF